MMKLVACATLLLVAALAAVQGDIYEKPGYQLQVRKRLGHMNEKPFIDLYVNYGVSLMSDVLGNLPHDDYHRYLPGGDDCMNFLRAFRVNGYKLTSLHEFIKLDACLGYLYQSQHHEQDSEEMKVVRDYLDELKNDEQLQALWANTKIEELDDDTKSCFSDLLLNEVLTRGEFSKVLCNNHYLQLYLQFAECQDGRISAEQRENDSYLKFIYNLLKERVQQCVHFEYQHIERAVRKAYSKAIGSRLGNFLKRFFWRIDEQQRERMWPWQVIRLLKVVENPKHGKEVNLRESLKLVRGVAMNDTKLIQRLFDNMAAFANFDLMPRRIGFSNKYDTTGLSSYTNFIDRLCSFFRSSDSESDYDFATPIVRLVQLLKYPQLFEIDKNEFTKAMIAESTETAPIYIGVGACNILTYTEGAIKPKKPGDIKTKPQFIVKFKSNTTGMVLWPQLGYY